MSCSLVYWTHKAWEDVCHCICGNFSNADSMKCSQGSNEWLMQFRGTLLFITLEWFGSPFWHDPAMDYLRNLRLKTTTITKLSCGYGHHYLNLFERTQELGVHFILYAIGRKFHLALALSFCFLCQADSEDGQEGQKIFVFSACQDMHVCSLQFHMNVCSNHSFIICIPYEQK